MLYNGALNPKDQIDLEERMMRLMFGAAIISNGGYITVSRNSLKSIKNDDEIILDVTNDPLIGIRLRLVSQEEAESISAYQNDALEE